MIMKKIILFFISLFFYTLLYSQNQSESTDINKKQNEVSQTSDANASIIGVWTLKEMRLVKNEDRDLNILIEKDIMSTEDKNNFSEKDKEAIKSFYELKNLISEKDSGVYKYNSKMKEDSIIVFDIRSDGSFYLGNIKENKTGKWQKNDKILKLLTNGPGLSFFILYTSNDRLIVQNIKGRKRLRMFFEK